MKILLAVVLTIALHAAPILRAPAASAQSLDEAMSSAQAIITGDLSPRQRMLNSHLRDAVSGANDAEIRRLIGLGADPNASDGVSWAPLTNAVFSHGFTPIMATLVSLGADIHFKGICGKTALHAAASSGRLEAAQFLLARGAEIDVKGCGAQTPLLEAADRHQVALAAFFLANGANPNAKNGDERSALSLASRYRLHESLKIAGLLLANPRTDVNVVDKDGMTPLKLAAVANNLELVKLLLKAPGIDVNNDAGGFSALFLADLKGFKEITVLLRAAGATALALN